MRSVTAMLLLFSLSLTALGCHRETEEDKVRKVIIGIQKSAEQKDIKKIITNLSKTYADPQGFNYDTIRGVLLGHFLRHPKISSYITNLEISVQDTFAKAAFQAVLTARSTDQSAANPIPESLGMYAFVVSLNKEPEGWKVISAAWERVGDNEAVGGR